MTEREYNIAIGKLMGGALVDTDEIMRFIDVLSRFESLLNQTDQDDYFGTQGWRYLMGWEE